MGISVSASASVGKTSSTDASASMNALAERNEAFQLASTEANSKIQLARQKADMDKGLDDTQTDSIKRLAAGMSARSS